jgi:hypothetical protein
MCTNEAERHASRAEVIQVIRDHVEPAETYRLDGADLEFGELLPRAPEWLAQDEYEDRNRLGFSLDRMAKAVDGLAGRAHGLLCNHEAALATRKPGIIEDTDEH